MREIKFRGWHEKLNRMIYGISVCNSYSSWIDENGKSWIFEENIMQYAGLKNNKGTEIYEGDIVNVYCSGISGAMNDGIYVVSYAVPDCAFCLVQLDGKFAINFNECYDYEVIGNIYENPELLK